MSSIVPFEFDNRAVRVVSRADQPWFVLADVCAVLGISNPTQAASRLDADERAMENIGRQGDATVVSLPGLLTLILRCKGAMKPDTLPYRVRKWITAEVVPTIMRSGSYGNAHPPVDLNDSATLQRLLLAQAGKALGHEDRIAALEPKADALDRLADAQGSLCITDAAKALAVPPRRLFAWLEANHWTYRRSEGGQWVAFEAKRQAGMLEHKGTRIEVRGRPDRWVEQVMVTPKGLARLAQLKAGA